MAALDVTPVVFLHISKGSLKEKWLWMWMYTLVHMWEQLLKKLRELGGEQNCSESISK